MPLSFDNLPPGLAQESRVAWQNICERVDQELAARIDAAAEQHPAVEQLPRVLALSPFIANTFRSRPAMLLDLLTSGELWESFTQDHFETALQAALQQSEEDIDTVLRRFRSWHMVRIVWRDFCRLADTLETVRDTSALAVACIRQALDWHYNLLVQRFGTPLGRENGRPQQLIVLAMGKLGAGELNVSSDIDLVFAYPEAGHTDGESRQLSNEEFFTRVGRGLINSLDQMSAEGFVFRVDMRLRPYGDSGALVHNFSALEEYYEEQGRDWERYALIKARAVTGDAEAARALMRTLRPFIFRRYVDFGVIDSLRGMKQMINAEVRRRGLEQDVKLGPGGIREVEFIGQCFQLIRGGRDLGLQQREILPVLVECAELGCLPRTAVEDLRDAYLFLRDSEHAIQGYRDKQSQALPSDELPRLAMANTMGFADWDSYMHTLDGHRQRVRRHFDDLIAEPDEDDHEPADDLALWGEGLGVDSLEGLGYLQAERSEESLQQLRQSPRVLTLQAEGRERLEQFMPQLLRACSGVDDPDLALQRLLPLVKSVLRRSAYLALLLENPAALDELVALCGASPWIAEQMAQHPALLDEFLDKASLYTAPDKELLRDGLRQEVARLPLEDLEAQMDALRYFKASNVLRVAASELSGRLPLMQVSDNLSWIAEVILEQVLAVAWADMTGKYGEPARDGTGYGFAIYGYGKLGGIELGYGSDLDLVFVSDAHSQGVTDGERSIDNTVFYTRLGQRMIHMLETRMSLGQLYEVDMRLRPSGESGMLVTTARGFSSYQEQSAWTWEHQALVRARFVAGDEQVAQKVNEVRREILCQEREPAELASEVQRMRNRMREHLLPDKTLKDGEFHLKQGLGGIVDIEFMVQYAVLAWSHSVPELARWSDNVRILETLGREGIFEQSESRALTEAYLAYRSAAHQLSLQQQPGVVPGDRFDELRSAVVAKWRQLFDAYPVIEK